ncbi:MAG TPA: pitrilysin family protein [Acidobacteriota bacterium]|nr:pitrilysin family protein [Acidobacteriota bacterium]
MRDLKVLSSLLVVAAVCSLAALSPAQEKAGFTLPTYDKFVLDNGLTVYLMEHHEVPLVYVSVVFPAGAVYDGDKFGLANLTGEGLLFGTENYSKEKIEETFDFYGAGISTGASLETASVNVSCAVKDVEILFPILAEVITKPVFDEQELTKRKMRLLAELAQAKESPRRVIGSYFNRFVFGDHPYGNPVGGTPTTVSRLSAEDLKSFYNIHFRPEGSAIAVVGDFKAADMKARITGMLSGWKALGDAPGNPLEGAGLPEFDKPRLLLINKDDATETTFLIGGKGVKRGTPDYIPIMVINTILGGRFTSWLNDELRVNAGLTYGARSSFAAYQHAGTFSMSSFTRNETTVEAIDLALKVYDRLLTEGVDQETLDSAKAYVKGQYPPDFETAGQLAGLLTSMFVYGYDESFINNFEETVDSITVEKAREIIGNYFPRGNLQFVLVGKAADIKEAVSKYGDLSEKEIKAEGY